MHLDPGIAFAGLGVGFLVGLTGMGGGALMTPLLVLVFHVPPLGAVSSDLVASVVMKPVGGAVHLRRGTVHTGLVRWLVLGSVPSAFGGALLLRALGDGDAIQSRLETILGFALVLAAASIAAKSAFARRRSGGSGESTDVRVRPILTVLIGAIGGLFVGVTSVGSGSLIMVMLLAVYPALRPSQLVGTDLVQAIPLVASAALGHVLFGDFQLALTSSVVLGSIPGVYAGATVSSRANTPFLRPVLGVVLLASGLKLLDVPPVPVVVVAVVTLASVVARAVHARLVKRPTAAVS